MVVNMIKLIVGLGNPGIKYNKTRHNIGAYCVFLLAKKQKQTLKEKKNFLDIQANVNFLIMMYI